MPDGSQRSAMKMAAAFSYTKSDERRDETMATMRLDRLSAGVAGFPSATRLETHSTSHADMPRLCFRRPLAVGG